MGYFPLCIDIRGKKVLCVGSGRQIQDKIEKLKPFEAEIVRTESVRAEDLERVRPALVVVGDTEASEAEKICTLCRERGIPVNVVDVPELCTFYFPALITRGGMTVSVSTGGKSPAAAAYVKQQVETVLPDATEEILEWISRHRSDLRERGILKEAVAKAFELGRPLNDEEILNLQLNICK